MASSEQRSNLCGEIIFQQVEWTLCQRESEESALYARLQPTAHALINSSMQTSDKLHIIITAAAPKGRRYDPNMTPDHQSSTANGIWLCSNCHTVIDRFVNEIFDYQTQVDKARR